MEDLKQIKTESQIEILKARKKQFLEESVLELDYWKRMVELQKTKTEYHMYMMQELQALSQIASMKLKPKEDADSKNKQDSGGRD